MKVLSFSIDLVLITSVVFMLNMGGINIQNNFLLTTLIMIVVVGLSLKAYAEGIDAGTRMYD